MPDDADVIEKLRRLTPEQREEIRAEAQAALDTLTARITATNRVLERLVRADSRDSHTQQEGQ